MTEAHDATVRLDWRGQWMLGSILGFVAAQAGSATVSPPPPVIIAVPDYSSRSGSTREPVRSVILDVEVRGGDQLLWSGPMRVSAQNGASLDRRKSDAPERCSASERGYDSSVRELLSMNLSLRDGTGPLISASVTWERSMDGADCQGGRRTVSFNETFLVEPGKSKTIKADAGLTVTFRPR